MSVGNMTQQSLTSVTAQVRHEVERFAAQARFAEGLCALHPEQAEAWRPLIARAQARVQAVLPGGSLEALRGAIAEAETILAPLAATAKSYTVHCVGHAHIDMNWMWSWPETVAVTNDSFLTVLRLMDEFPEFCFSQSQASVYAIIERHNPAMLERIAQRVREGRWEVTASHWVEGDKNLAGGESLTRHLLYTRRYMQQLFGLSPEDVPIDWAPDTFGHAATMPTYLVRGGVKYLYLHRPGIHGEVRPEAFWWQGPDGSRVLVKNDMRRGYNGRIEPWIATDYGVSFAQETGSRDVMYVYGVGDHGGGPTRRDLLRAVEMDRWPIFPQIKFSTARAFFQALEGVGERLPLIAEELNTEFTGCYTTQTLIKKANRFAEARLQDAEVAASVASLAAGFPYPAADFQIGWRDTLFNHFHDILPGSGVHDTRTYTHGLYQQTMAITGQVETQALRQLAAAVDTSADAGAPRELPTSAYNDGLGAGVGFHTVDGALSFSEQSSGSGPRPMLLFNPTAWERREVIEATIWDSSYGSIVTPLNQRSYRVQFPDGASVPAQLITNSSYWGHEYATLAFPASVPALGYTVATIIDSTTDPATPAAADAGVQQLGLANVCSYASWERSPEGLENACVRLEIDPVTGGIRRLVEKASGQTLIADAPVLEYAVERPHGMTAWVIDHTGPVEYPLVTGHLRTLHGPYKAAIAVNVRIHESEFTVTYELRQDDPRVYVHIAGTWFQRGTPQTGVPVLRLALPSPLTDARARYEIPFGAIDRTLNNGVELPALQWAQVTGDEGGFVLMNDSKHGHALDGSTLRLTLIRSSYDPDILPEIGQHEVHLAIQPFTGEMTTAAATRAARELNHALRVIGTDVHAGSLPREAEALAITPGTVMLSCVKRAEDGDGLIIRLYDTAGRDTEATVTLDPALLGAITDAQQVDLLERPLAPATVAGNTVTATIPAYGIVTLLVKTAR